MFTSLTLQNSPLAPLPTPKTPVLPKNTCPALTSSVHQYFMVHSPKDLGTYLPDRMEYLIHSGNFGSFTLKDIEVLNEGLSGGAKIPLPLSLVLTPSNTDPRVPYPFSSTGHYVSPENWDNKIASIYSQVSAKIVKLFEQKNYDLQKVFEQISKNLDRQTLTTQLGYREYQLDNITAEEQRRMAINYYQSREKSTQVILFLNSLPEYLREDQEIRNFLLLLALLSLNEELEASLSFTRFRRNQPFYHLPDLSFLGPLELPLKYAFFSVCMILMLETVNRVAQRFNLIRA